MSTSSINPDALSTAGELAEALTTLRGRAGLTIREVAKATGIPSATLGGYFSGRHLPPASRPDDFGRVLISLSVPADERAAWWDAVLRLRRTPGPRKAFSAPYRGLDSYRTKDADVFVGREQETARLLDIVCQLHSSPGHGAVALIGPSGSGKSSLLHAGLLRSADDTGIATHALSAGDLDQDILDGPTRRLVVVDQLERLLSDHYDATRRATLLRAAGRLAGTPGTVLALGLRSDCLDRALSDPDLAPLVLGEQLLLAPLPAEALRRVIVEPAERAGRPVTPEVVALALEDLAGGGAHALPLLSHALLMSWERAGRDEVGASAYVAAGGVRGAVQASAEAAYASLTPEAQDAARRLFRRLVLVDQDGTAIQRPLLHDDLGDDPHLEAAANAFVDHRILTAHEDRFELSHESVSTVWPRLRDWLDAESDSLRVHHRVAQAARLWEESHREPGSLLRGALLSAVRERGAEFWAHLSRTEEELVRASVAAAEDAEAHERRVRRRLRTLLAGVVVFAIVATVLATYLGVTVGEATRARDDADRARTEALSRQLAGEASLMREVEPSVAAQLAVAAYRISPTFEARSALLESTASRVVTRIVGPEGATRAIASPDGEAIAVAGADGRVRLYPADIEGEPVAEAQVDTDGGELFASAYNDDGSLLAVAGAAGKVTVLRITDEQPTVLATATTPDDAGVVSLVFDGDRLLAGTGVPSVEQWRVTGTGLAPLPAASGFGGQVGGLAVGPRGTIATASSDGAVRVWRRAAGDRLAMVRQLTVGDALTGVTSVSFSPDGRWLAAGSKDRTVRVWAARRDYREVATLRGFKAWVNSVAFSPDGEHLLAGASGAEVRAWRAGSWESTLELAIGGANIGSVAWSVEGTELITSSINGVTRLVPFEGPAPSPVGDAVWSVGQPSGGERAYLGTGAQDPAVYVIDLADVGRPTVEPVAFTAPAAVGDLTGSSSVSPDGEIVVGGTESGRVAVWRTDGPRDRPVILEAATALVEATSFAPDSSMFAVASDDETVTLFSTDGYTEADTPPQKVRSITVDGLALGVSFSPDGTLLAVGTSANSLELYRVADGSRLSVMKFDNYVYGSAFSPDGTLLAGGGADRSVRIWDVSDPGSPRAVDELTGPTGATFTVVWHPSGTRLAATSQEGNSVWIWTYDGRRFRRYADVAGLDAGAISLAWTHQGRALLAGGLEGGISTWLASPEDAVDLVCRSTGSQITEDEWARHVTGLDHTYPCGSPRSTARGRTALSGL